jgi:CDP-glucose 4,6-dehydratase
VRWIAERFVQLWGQGASWKLDGAGHPHEAQHLRLDSTKARTRLGWQPRWSLGQALERIVDWHQAQGQGRDMREFSLGQIAAYQGR